MDDIKDIIGGSTSNQLPKLPALRVNGKTGEVLLTHLDQEKGENGYPQEVLEAPIDLIFMNIRRKLVKGDNNGLVYASSEHNQKGDVVSVYNFQTQKTEVGDSDTLREGLDLKTEQVVYALYNDKVIRVSIKGTSLRKLKESDGFYSYLQSFGENRDWYKYKTRLGVFKNEENGYYGFSFTRAKESHDKVEEVVNHVRAIASYTTAHDAQVTKQVNQPAQQAPVVSDIPLPEENQNKDFDNETIDPDDIPFNKS